MKIEDEAIINVDHGIAIEDVEEGDDELPESSLANNK